MYLSHYPPALYRLVFYAGRKTTTSPATDEMSKTAIAIDHISIHAYVEGGCEAFEGHDATKLRPCDHHSWLSLPQILNSRYIAELSMLSDIEEI